MSYLAMNYVLHLEGLTPVEKACAFVLACHQGNKGRGAYIGMTTLAKESGLKNRETASRVARRLVEKGVIFPVGDVSKGGFGPMRTTTYFINCGKHVRSSGKTARPATHRPHLPPAQELISEEEKLRREQRKIEIAANEKKWREEQRAKRQALAAPGEDERELANG
jgi:hypothetical protein